MSTENSLQAQLADPQLDRLETLLAEPALAEAMRLDEIQGYLCAALSGPRPVEVAVAPLLRVLDTHRVHPAFEHDVVRDGTSAVHPAVVHHRTAVNDHPRANVGGGRDCVGATAQDEQRAGPIDAEDVGRGPALSEDIRVGPEVAARHQRRARPLVVRVVGRLEADLDRMEPAGQREEREQRNSGGE